MRGVEIAVATPAACSTSCKATRLKLGESEFLVLDEADRMLDMGFINDMRKIVGKLPIKRQTLFFSATMPKDIATRRGDAARSRPRGGDAGLLDRRAQRILEVDFAAKPAILAQLLKQERVIGR